MFGGTFLRILSSDFSTAQTATVFSLRGDRRLFQWSGILGDAPL